VIGTPPLDLTQRLHRESLPGGHLDGERPTLARRPPTVGAYGGGDVDGASVVAVPDLP
jgi:hypothetical protein